MAEVAVVAQSIEEFLERHEASELLRFTTAGSVDDGKSTLIGRLLYDTKGVYEDQLQAVKNSRLNRSTAEFDLSLLTDGLRAEREQGITIDVAYRYFSTPRRKFIIADTPGHEQYTRNMATGASTASLAVVLVDARKGVLPQSRRHAYISWLLGIPHLVVAVNKMDLVDFSAEVFEKIRADFLEFGAKLHLPEPIFIPISALDGDNVVSASKRTPWYDGPTLLDHLETVPIATTHNFTDLRFPVQYVIRPDLDFRGYAGQLASGTLHPGDAVMVLPSGRTSRVRSIETYDGRLQVAFPPQSVTVTLQDEIDISRGDMLVNAARAPHVSRRLEAMLVWMNAEPLEVGRPYHIKHTTQITGATFRAVQHRVDVNTLDREAETTLGLNEIGRVSIETTRPLYYDAYAKNRATGAFIVIDPISNVTLAAGMLLERSSPTVRQTSTELLQFDPGRLTPAERYSRSGHLPATVWLTARADLAWLVERRLFDRGCQVLALADDTESNVMPELARILNKAGLIAICSIASDEPAERARARTLLGESQFLEFAPEALPAADDEAAQVILRRLEERGILRKEDFDAGEGI
jgi:sulfate adenylyltransferase large subunit